MLIFRPKPEIGDPASTSNIFILYCQLPINGVVYELQLYELQSTTKCGIEAEPVSTAFRQTGSKDEQRAWG